MKHPRAELSMSGTQDRMSEENQSGAEDGREDAEAISRIPRLEMYRNRLL